MLHFTYSAATAFIAIIIVCSGTEAGTLRFKCEYASTFAPGQTSAQSANGFSLEFAIDDATAKAVMLGNNGLSDVGLHTGSEGLTFIEALPTGAVQTTTVSIPSGQSVHSRHSMLAGKMVPSQFYGDCRRQ